jgi:hypothetical protein
MLFCIWDVRYNSSNVLCPEVSILVVKNAANEQAQRESGAQIHRRETRRQVYLPFMLALFGLLGMVLLVALPTNPIWRVRAQAIADWTYTILCLAPAVLCLFPVFLLVAVAIWGMNRLHLMTERPLHRLEDLATNWVTRINTASEYVQHKTIDVSSTLEPAMKMISAFDSEEASDVRTE